MLGGAFAVPRYGWYALYSSERALGNVGLGHASLGAPCDDLGSDWRAKGVRKSTGRFSLVCIFVHLVSDRNKLLSSTISYHCGTDAFTHGCIQSHGLYICTHTHTFQSSMLLAPKPCWSGCTCDISCQIW